MSAALQFGYFDKKGIPKPAQSYFLVGLNRPIGALLVSSLAVRLDRAKSQELEAAFLARGISFREAFRAELLPINIRHLAESRNQAHFRAAILNRNGFAFAFDTGFRFADPGT